MHAALSAHAHNPTTSDTIAAATHPFRAQWADALADIYALVTHEAGVQLYAEMLAGGHLPNDAAYDGLSESSAADLAPLLTSKADSIVATTTHRLSAVVTAALAASDENPDIHAAVDGLYDAWVDDGRADEIATTEGNGAWGTGLDDAAAQAADGYGVSLLKTWNAVGDARTRPEHAEADGQQVANDEDFTVGGESLNYPGDPGGSPAMTYNCRCWATYDVVSAGSE